MFNVIKRSSFAASSSPSFLEAYWPPAFYSTTCEAERQWGMGVVLLLVVARRRRRRRKGMGEQGEMGEEKTESSEEIICDGAVALSLVSYSLDAADASAWANNSLQTADVITF